jgi:hypothetical protein
LASSNQSEQSEQTIAQPLLVIRSKNIRQRVNVRKNRTEHGIIPDLSIPSPQVAEQPTQSRMAFQVHFQEITKSVVFRVLRSFLGQIKISFPRRLAARRCGKS